MVDKHRSENLTKHEPLRVLRFPLRQYLLGRVVTGGTLEQKFSPEPCLEESCKHFELVDVLSGNGEKGNVHSKAWIQGSSQSVPGGKGFLRWVNGGEERTGVPVWTTDAHVKLSLEDIDEGGNGEPATARVWLDFQLGVYPPFLGEHCTPHFFSFPTPWKVQEGGLMVVFSRASAPDIIDKIKDQIEPFGYASQNQCRGDGCEKTSDSILINPLPDAYATSEYGHRNIDVKGASKFHEAIDLAYSRSDPRYPGQIIAAGDGVVTYAGRSKSCGTLINIDHLNGLQTGYCHMSEIYVRRNQPVVQGQVIGKVGNRGVSSAPHLHFIISENGRKVNPRKYVKF